MQLSQRCVHSSESRPSTNRLVDSRLGDKLANAMAAPSDAVLRPRRGTVFCARTVLRPVGGRCSTGRVTCAGALMSCAGTAFQARTRERGLLAVS